MKYFEFKYDDEFRTVNTQLRVDNDATHQEIVEAFIDFLNGTGYVIHSKDDLFDF